MAGSGPSTSGRVLDGGAAAFHSGLPRFTVLAPRGRAGQRASSRQRVVVCEALALPSRLHLPFLKAFHHLFKAPQEARPEAIVVEIAEGNDVEDGSRHRTPFGYLLRQATYAAINVGLRVTGIALRLAKSVVDDVRRTVRLLQVQQQVEKEAEEARKAFDAKTLQEFEARRAMLRTRGQDPEFMQMLHCLDRCHMDHDVKWALVQKHTADKADFSEALQHLFQKACDSKEAVETLLRPDATHSERSRFWKSEQTAALIAEEESLKQLVFAQMLQAS